jgi:hypothetical protein
MCKKLSKRVASSYRPNRPLVLHTLRGLVRAKSPNIGVHSPGPRARLPPCGRLSLSKRVAARWGCIARPCELPATSGLSLSRDSGAELHRLVIESGVTDASASTIWRWVREDVLRPWQRRSWIFIRDSDFRAKAARVLDLYERRFEGRRLRPDELVVGAYDKSQPQVGPPRQSLRPRRSEDRDRAVRAPGRAGDGPRALRLGPDGVLDRRQRLLARWTRVTSFVADHSRNRWRCVERNSDRKGSS